MSNPNVPHLRPVPGPSTEGALANAVEGEVWDGITRPARRHVGQRFLTDVIVELGLAPADRVEQAVEQARTSGTTPEQVLLDSGALGTDGLARAVAERHGLDHVDLTVFNVDLAAANLLPSSAAKRYDAIPIALDGDRALKVAMADPSNVHAIDDIALVTGYEVRPVVASPDDIAGLISRLTRISASPCTTKKRSTLRRW